MANPVRVLVGMRGTARVAESGIHLHRKREVAAETSCVQRPGAGGAEVVTGVTDVGPGHYVLAREALGVTVAG